MVGVISLILGGVYALYLVQRRRYRRLNTIWPDRIGPVVRSSLTFVPPEAATPNTSAPPPVPDNLVAALVAGQAVLVVGAGASARAGYPTGHGLLIGLLNRLRGELPSVFARIADSTDRDAALQDLIYRLGGFGKCIDLLLSSVPREIVLREIEEILANTNPSDGFHTELARLPWRGVLSLVWDDYADRVFNEVRQRETWQTLGLDDAGDIAGVLRGQTRLFLRPLGTIREPGSMSLSIEEFRRNLVRAPEFARGLGLLLQTQTFLFLGVGPETLEQFLQAVAPEHHATSSRHFAVMPDDGIHEVWSTSLAKFGVATLPYANQQFHLVDGFVENLAEQYRQRAEEARFKPKVNGTLSQFRVTRLRLMNIGLFESLDLAFDNDPIPETGKLPWTVIFGENGCGKSTILRAICVALAGKDADGAAQPLLRTGAREGVIELHTELADQPLRTQINRDGTRVRVTSTQTSPVEAGIALILGFPSLRGAPSPNPAGPRKYEAHDPETADLMPLVTGEVDKRLSNFKQWLVNVLVASNDPQDRRNKAIRSLLNQIIRDVIPGDIRELASISGQPYTIRVVTDAGEVPFEEISLGMASIFNWIGVLTQRLYDVYPESKQPEAEQAIVLVDEIDAHLHPEWQRKLVDLTKKYFPRLQVIATSHSPLLAGCLRRQEVRVLDRNGAQLDVMIDPFGQSSQSLLTGPLFNLPFDRNLQAEEIIVEYTNLFQKRGRTEAEDKRLDELREQIAPLNYAMPWSPPPLVAPSPALRDALNRALVEARTAAEAGARE